MTLKSATERAEIDVAIRRSDFYLWLSRALRHPDADLVASLDEPSLAYLEEGLERLSEGSREALRPVLTTLRASATRLDLAHLQ